MMGEAIFLAFEDPVHQGGWILVIASYASLQNLLLRVLSLAGLTARGCATLGEAELHLRRFGLPRLILFYVAAASEEALPPRLRELYTLLPLAADSCPVLVLSAMLPVPRAHMLPGRVRVVAKPFNVAHLLSVVSD